MLGYLSVFVWFQWQHSLDNQGFHYTYYFAIFLLKSTWLHFHLLAWLCTAHKNISQAFICIPDIPPPPVHSDSSLLVCVCVCVCQKIDPPQFIRMNNYSQPIPQTLCEILALWIIANCKPITVCHVCYIVSVVTEEKWIPVYIYTCTCSTIILPLADKLDPYVELVLLPKTSFPSVRSEKKKTSFKKMTSKPMFNETFQL